ncbi:hypothetical protein PGTUg99_000366 [Puccinia graminis f. sp. tritici]|uniref:Uncharacterized protein n=1 Tax=Puccinia graminis f. sp. tritici TaxID=56615 RepID=A0A5B0RT98_PUCGR|nr:hypothetical protein PGTUg99_000366 [Puccinia graminis f. sp. tritici]
MKLFVYGHFLEENLRIRVIRQKHHDQNDLEPRSPFSSARSVVGSLCNQPSSETGLPLGFHSSRQVGSILANRFSVVIRGGRTWSKGKQLQYD